MRESRQAWRCSAPAAPDIVVLVFADEPEQARREAGRTLRVGHPHVLDAAVVVERADAFSRADVHICPN